MSSFLEDVSSVGIVLLWCRQSCVQKRWGECLARCTPARLFTRITRNPVVRGTRVVATKSFEGEEVNKENIP